MIDFDFLQDFEETLDPSRGRSRYPMSILGYGEISVVFEVLDGVHNGIAFKRIPNFISESEVKAYISLFNEYELLLKEAGINLPESEATYVLRKDGKAVLYIAQIKLDPECICNKLIHRLGEEEIEELFSRVLNELGKIWKFNQVKDIEIGIDGQISNWALKGEKILYFDTDTPMVRKNGEHQINAEVFLRATPPVMRTIVKKAFLQEILDRYFDFRLVVVDLLANLFKEKKADVIPALIGVANDFFSDFFNELNSEIQPLTYEEIRKYYDHDAFIWSLYLNLRKLHRSAARLMGKRYEYFLPEKIER